MPDSDQTTQGVAEPDFDVLLRANLERVFNESNAGKRAAALGELFVDEPVMYEPTGKAVGHHGLGSLQWQAGPEGGPVTVTGADVAEGVDGRIARLWVLLNPPTA